jgi:hypothetical protein
VAWSRRTESGPVAVHVVVGIVEPLLGGEVGEDGALLE